MCVCTHQSIFVYMNGWMHEGVCMYVYVYMYVWPLCHMYTSCVFQSILRTNAIWLRVHARSRSTHIMGVCRVCCHLSHCASLTSAYMLHAANGGRFEARARVTVMMVIRWQTALVKGQQMLANGGLGGTSGGDDMNARVWNDGRFGGLRSINCDVWELLQMCCCETSGRE